MGSQKNKAHKAGRRAGLSAREKHKKSKGIERQTLKQTPKSGLNKLDRQNAARQQREKQREDLLAKRREVGAPRVVSVLPLSQAVNAKAVWGKCLAACTEQHREYVETDDAMQDADELRFPLQPTLSELPGRHQAYWIPPPKAREDLLEYIDLARHAEIVLLVFPETGEIDAFGELALSVLRDMGLPNLLSVVTPPAEAPLKVRAASKKLAAASLQLQGITDPKIHVADSVIDYRQLVRQIGDSSLRLPSWRQQRPSLLVESARIADPVPNSQGDCKLDTLVLRGFVRGLGLSANQAIHLPGAGDFAIKELRGPARPEPMIASSLKRRKIDNAMEVDSETPPLLAASDPEARESLQRENIPDALDAEQTWPTEEEYAEAKMDLDKKTRRLPKGTSEYQAAWILDEDFSDEETEEIDLQSPRSMPAAAKPADERADNEIWEEEMDEAETSYDASEDPSFPADAKKPSRMDQDNDLLFPDEMDTPEDIPARQRFAKYRGLKSWRSSPWDPKESLPSNYARIYAFQSMKRAEKRAKAGAIRVGSAGDASGVAAGNYVEVYVCNVPHHDAVLIGSRISTAARGDGSPYVAFGLLQHEARLSVLNFAIKKSADFAEPLPSKAPMLFVAGFRTFDAQPIFSTDEYGASKFKAERFLQPGQSAIATVYAPISYSPLPLLALHRPHDKALYKIAAAGSLRSCDPERIILKRIVLSGYPVRVHKKKAVVRWMFHNPDDVRWFRPLELWTKHGLRGRIKEPLGTHGAMKCIFDGTVKQSDAVCASLYKRVFPKWPANLAFT